jgi:hypothetical protein
MAQKENKGGVLTNEQIENDQKAKGVQQEKGGYKGTQDTGDDKIRSLGTEVQKKDGLSDKEVNK